MTHTTRALYEDDDVMLSHCSDCGELTLETKVNAGIRLNSGNIMVREEPDPLFAGVMIALTHKQIKLMAQAVEEAQ